MSIVFGGLDEVGKDVCYARFFTQAVEDPAQTAIVGRPIFHDVPFVQIKFRDDPFAGVSREVMPEDMRRYPKQWEAYEASQKQAGDGVPLDRAPFLGPSAVLNLKSAGIWSVDQLAGLDDAKAAALGPDGLTIRDVAKQYLAGDSKAVRDLRAKLAAQKAEIDALQFKLEQAQGMLEAARAAAEGKAAPGAKRAA